MKMIVRNTTVKICILGFLLLSMAMPAIARGQKYGLFIGINDYKAYGWPNLIGAVNDAKNVRKMMIRKFGFKAVNTTLLLDAAATRRGILEKIEMYEAKIKSGDLFVIHYSGHGTLFPDDSSAVQDETKMQYVEIDDEVWFRRDYYDSAIVPTNSDKGANERSWKNLILDDELYEIFSRFTEKGTQVVFISDSCHSGSIARAPKADVRFRFMPLHKVFKVESPDDLSIAKSAVPKRDTSDPDLGGLYITLTGANDDELAVDSTGGSTPMGLFTSELLKALGTKYASKMSYSELIKLVSPKVAKKSLMSDNDQNPQLDSRFGNAEMKVFSLPPVN